MTILALERVRKSYGALKVTDDISLNVAHGETLGIIGPNGAGKTTLFNLISGDVRVDGGRVMFADEEITALLPHARCRRGIGRSYQIPHPFVGMTVFENLLVAATFGGGLPLVRDGEIVGAIGISGGSVDQDQDVAAAGAAALVPAGAAA